MGEAQHGRRDYPGDRRRRHGDQRLFSVAQLGVPVANRAERPFRPGLRGPFRRLIRFFGCFGAGHRRIPRRRLSAWPPQARTLAPSPIRDLLHRRLQPICHLHDCSGCFRLERLPGGACTHWKAPPCRGAHVQRPFENDAAWWRGHAKADWRLQAHAHRRDPRHYGETTLIGHFVSAHPRGRIDPALTPTIASAGFSRSALRSSYPLVDRTEIRSIAAYFAVQDHHVVEDGCIWALWPTGLNRTFDAADGLVQIRDRRVAEIAESAFTDAYSEEILAIDGQEIDPRMLAQVGRCTLHSRRTALELGAGERSVAASVCDPKERQGQNSRPAFSPWHPALKPVPRS